MDNDLNVDVSASGSSGLSISWNDLDAVYYKVMCNGGTEGAYTQSHSISFIANGTTTTNIVIDQVIHDLSYNCCVSAFEVMPEPSTSDCAESPLLSGGVSAPVAGVIGGILGAVIAVLIILAVGAVVVLSFVYKTHK